MTIALSNQLPVGPWRAHLDLTSGVTTRHAAATIRFPGAAVKAKAISGYLILAAILLGVFILALIGAWLIRRRRRSSPTSAVASGSTPLSSAILD